MDNLLYKILGVEPSAALEEITKSYRKLAMKYHPDRKDGNQGKFLEVQRAYEVLRDTERRKRYDETGVEDARVEVMEDRVRRQLGELFVRIAANDVGDPASLNVMEIATSTLADEMSKLQGAKKNAGRMAARLKLVAKRLKRIDGVDNLGARMMELAAESKEAEVVVITERLTEIEFAQQELAKYIYEKDTPPDNYDRPLRSFFTSI